MTLINPNSEVRTFLETLRLLFNRGIRYSTVIDVGCADGSFFLTLWSMGIIPEAVPFNIDANVLYEESLKAIKAVVGGDYRISAIIDREGEIELTTSVHPYWSSLRPKQDPYWERVNNLFSIKTVVPAMTLDTLRKQLQPPFLLKLDVQGAEQEVLRGATDTLRNTHVVICEADIADFRKIDNFLEERDFIIYDLTAFGRTADGTLGWFYRSTSIVRSKMSSLRNFGILETTKPLYRRKCVGANRFLSIMPKSLRECSDLFRVSRDATTGAHAARAKNISAAAVLSNKAIRS